jgi:AAA15 family ATPase/GTPase
LRTEQTELDESVKNAMTAFLSTLRESFPQPSDIEIPKIMKPIFQHRGLGETRAEFNADNESEGTMAYFSLLGPVVRALEKGGVLCIDELDSSLHPLLALELVRIFSDRKSNPLGAQMVFNTHDTNLLDSSLLRRDQVWFTEKDSSGSTHLYPLSDFRPRKNENLKRGYLQGRYGAIPFLEHELAAQGTGD